MQLIHFEYSCWRQINKVTAQKWAICIKMSFAYEDGQKEYYPRPMENAAIYRTLTKRIWLRKYSILRETYRFEKESWEVKTTPREEAFWQFTNPFLARKWLNNGGIYRWSKSVHWSERQFMRQFQFYPPFIAVCFSWRGPG